MELDYAIAEGKWRLLQELSKKDQSASDLAKVLKTSVANINQQLKLLEAYGLIRKEKGIRTGKAGKPKSIYILKRNQQFLVSIKKGNVSKTRLSDFWIYDILFKIMATVDDQRDAYYLLKFCFQTEEILKRCQAMAFMKSTPEAIELVLLTQDLEKIRKEYSNIIIKDLDEKPKKIVCWSHNEKELKDGLERKEPYFMNLLNDLEILFDKEGKLSEVIAVRQTL
jgi:predicted transcriptional regulator